LEFQRFLPLDTTLWIVIRILVRIISIYRGAKGKH
jgi:hypothetical protein